MDRLRTRSTIAISLLAGCIMMDLWMVLALSDVIDVLDRVPQGLAGSRDDADALDRVDTTEMVALGSFVVTGVAFLFWFSCAYGHAARLAPGTMRFTQGWAAGSWFVPILNLVRPKQIADDLWRAGEADGTARTVSPLLHCWWAALMGAAVLERVAYGKVNAADGDGERAAAAGNLPGVMSAIDAYSSAVSLARIGLLVDVAAAVLAIVVVRSVTARLAERDRSAAVLPPSVAPAFGGGAVPPPTWAPAPTAPVLTAPATPLMEPGPRPHSVPPPPRG